MKLPRRSSYASAVIHSPLDSRSQASGERAASPASPLLFVLPGLGGEQRLFKHVPGAVPIRYMEWTEAIRPGCDYSAQFADVKSQIERAMAGGPVRLVGYSVGGSLAYACAVAFQAEGRPVDCVVILDVEADLDNTPPTPLRKRLRKRLDDLLTFKVRAGLAALLAKALTRKSAAPFLRRAARFRHAPLPFRFDTYLHHRINMQLQLPMIAPWWREIMESRPSLNAPVFLFRSEEHEPSEAEDLGWSRLCGDLRVVSVPGSHSGMLKPENNAALCSSILQAMNLPQTTDSRSQAMSATRTPTPSRAI